MQPDVRDVGYLHDILQFAEEARVIVERAADPDYLSDLATRRALERCLELIGEAAQHVSAAFQSAHPEIPWREIIGQRHRLIHGYRDIDSSRIRNVIDRRLPALVAQVQAALPPSPVDPDPER